MEGCSCRQQQRETAAVEGLEKEKSEATYSKPPPYVVLAVKKCSIKTAISVEVG